LGITYQLKNYEVDPEHLDAETVALKVGMEPEQVYKTLLARGDRTGLLFAVIAANSELCFKALARASGDRQVEMVPLKDVQPLTGYIRGGVTALAAKKALPVFVDELVEICDVIAVSAGIRGTQILIAPADYVRATGATVAPIARAKG
jgi:Cys-tRNA(Pro)/Cys-tRNA(Cys) deacylase